MSLKPVRDRIILKPDAAESLTASGLIIPESARERPCSGVVVSSGACDLAPGDRVLYSEWGGSEIKHEGETYVVLSVRDVWAVMSGD